jgi:hypothetical protein
MKQTAVEWYSNKLVEILGDMCNEFTQEQTLANHYALKQAKEMEKQQIEKMYSEVKVFTEELNDRIDSFEYSVNQNSYVSDYVNEWFEQFKKDNL